MNRITPFLLLICLVMTGCDSNMALEDTDAQKTTSEAVLTPSDTAPADLSLAAKKSTAEIVVYDFEDLAINCGYRTATIEAYHDLTITGNQFIGVCGGDYRGTFLMFMNVRVETTVFTLPRVATSVSVSGWQTQSGYQVPSTITAFDAQGNELGSVDLPVWQGGTNYFLDPVVITADGIASFSLTGAHFQSNFQDLSITYGAVRGKSKVDICHATGSKKKPFVKINVAESAVNAHMAHGDKFPSADGLCK